MVGYIGNPPKNAEPEININIVVLSVPVCINNPTIDDKMVNQLNTFVTKFQESFDKFAIEGGIKQYAVLFYGRDIISVNPPLKLFDANHQIIEGSDWLAALPNPPQHSEYIILSHIDCTATRKKDIYLFTYHRPCIYTVGVK